MKQEEKLKEAQRLYETANADQRYVLESLFPELKESEDERTRKEIVRFIRMEVEDKIVGNKWLAWLENQGEKEPVEWSEKDEHKVKDIIYFLNSAKVHYASDVELNGCIKWLWSLLQRMGLKKK